MTWLRKHLLFAVIVLVPTVAAILYYGLIASDVYISESRFVIRSPQRQQQAGLFGALLQGSALTRAQDDTYSVHDFILSRDALRELDEKLGVTKLYSGDKADVIGRFPAFDFDRSFEAFHRYWQNKATVDLDSTSISRRRWGVQRMPLAWSSSRAVAHRPASMSGTWATASVPASGVIDASIGRSVAYDGYCKIW